MERDVVLEYLRQTDYLKIHITYTIREFSLFVANTPDIRIKCLYSSLSFSTNMQNHACSDHNINHLVCGVRCVVWGLVLVQQGQR